MHGVLLFENGLSGSMESKAAINSEHVFYSRWLKHRKLLR